MVSRQSQVIVLIIQGTIQFGQIKIDKNFYSPNLPSVILAIFISLLSITVLPSNSRPRYLSEPFAWLGDIRSTTKNAGTVQYLFAFPK